MHYSLWLIFLQFFVAFAEQKFNIFKSYANADVKPPQYTKQKKHLRHSINEYLDPMQKKMKQLRESPDTPGAMYDSKWSGFNLKENKDTIFT
jgi:tryptophanyl-tRNA synthetase